MESMLLPKVLTCGSIVFVFGSIYLMLVRGCPPRDRIYSHIVSLPKDFVFGDFFCI